MPYPGLNANEIQIPYDVHHKVSSLVESHKNKHKYEVMAELRSSIPI